jgi:CDP-paratose 2-epimerase
VLVTGGAGFIGSHAAEFFAKEGNEVLVMDNLSRFTLLRKGEEWQYYNLEYLRKNYPSIVFIKGDVCDLRELNKVSRT